MSILILILLLGAAVCFLLTAFNVAPSPKVNWLGLGLLLWVLVPLVRHIANL